MTSITHEKRTRNLFPVFAAVAVLAAALALAGCDNLFNGDKDKEDTDQDTGLPLTAEISFGYTAANSSGINLMAAAPTGIGTADQHYYFSVEEKTAAIFTVTKTQAQTLTLGGTDAAKVTRTESGTVEDEGSTAGPTLEIFTLKFDDITRYFGGERNFTLTVSEEGKSPKTIGITLAAEPDIADPGCTIFEVSYPNGVETLTRRVDAELEDTPVDNLTDALKWIDIQTASGTAGASESDEPEWKEYLVRLEKHEEIPKMAITCAGADYVKIRLRGAGAERRITYDGSGKNGAYGTGNKNVRGILGVNGSTSSNYVALQIEDRLTLDGKNTPFVIITNFYLQNMVYVEKSGRFIMEEGSKITGHIPANDSNSYAAVVLKSDSAFFMRGGEISGNTLLSASQPIIYTSRGPEKPWIFEKTGGVFRNNTFEGTPQNYITWVADSISVPENDSATQIKFTSRDEFGALME